jgi:hypothetical protein
MKKILHISLALSITAVSGFAQQGYRYDVVPGNDNTYAIPHKEIASKTYAATIRLSPTMEETVYDFGQLTGALTVSVVVTPCFTGDKMSCLFHADGTNRVVTFGAGFTSSGTLTVPASTYSTINFIFNGVAWYESTRQNNVSGTVTTLAAGNGTAGAPSITFTSDGDLGLYRVGANDLGITSGGTKVVDISSTNTTFTTPITELRTATTYTATGSITVSAAELGGGLLVAATSTATTTFTLPTASQVATQLGATAGSTFTFVILNTGASNGTVTVAVGSGIVASDFPGTNTLTRTGSATVGAAVFRLTFLSTSAAILTRTS